MTYSLTKIKTFLGMEGHGLNAVILQDTTPICFVLDDAHGGEIQFDFTNPGQNGKSFEANRAHADVREKAFGEFCLKWYDESGERAKDDAQWAKWNKDSGKLIEREVTAHSAMEHWVNHLVTTVQIEKDVRRSLTNRVLFTKKGKKGIYQSRVIRDPAALAELISKAEVTFKDADKILNKLPFDQAVAVYRAQA